MPDLRRTLLESAAHHLERAVQLSPRESRFAIELGKVRLALGDAATSIPLLTRGLTLDAPPQLAQLLAVAHLDNGEPGEAARYATMALEDNDGFRRARALLAECAYQTGRLDAAIEEMRAILQSRTHDRWRVRLGAWLLEKGLLTEGDDRRSILSEARDLLLQGMPQYGEPEWRYVVGCVLLELGEPRRASVHLARTSFPGPGATTLRLALAELQLGHRGEAARLLTGCTGGADLAEDVARLQAIIDQRRTPALGSVELASPPWKDLPALDSHSLMPRLGPRPQVGRTPVETGTLPAAPEAGDDLDPDDGWALDGLDIGEPEEITPRGAES